MAQEEVIQATEQEMWAIVELMGHGRTAGRISRLSDFGGMLRVDVPTEDGTYRTEFYGMPAIYSVKLVSEEIARAYTEPMHDAIAYDTPIVTREQHEGALRDLQMRNRRLERQVGELERRLISVRALPSGEDDDIEF
jgi:hypothetical protein